MSNLQQAVGEYTQYLSTQIGWIDNLQSDGPKDNIGLYKKILHIALLDTMSKSVFPHKGNRDRFVAFLKSFCEWPEGDRVSLPHLLQLLSKAPDPIFSELRKHAYSEIDKWGEGELIPLARDFTIADLSKLWPSQKEARFPIQGVQLESIQHWHLFYTYRNGLIHEFRTLGKGIEIRDDGSPYYHTLTYLDETDSWELVYPTAFVRGLCVSGLAKLKRYLVENRLDPFNVYDFGTFWLSELN